jgi:hypothetical protein
VSLPKAAGLDETPTNFSNRTKLMTIAYYIVGGLVAAATINAIEDKKGPL